MVNGSLGRLSLVSLLLIVSIGCGPAAPAAKPAVGAAPAATAVAAQLVTPVAAQPVTPVAAQPVTAAPPAQPTAVGAVSAPSGASTTQPAQQTEATILGSWFPQPEEGGYYLAENEGLYAARNVSMSLKAGGPGVDVVKLVAVGQYKFGMAVGDQIALARNEGVPVVALMSPFQKYPQIIMVHEESGIKDFEDIGRLGIRVAVGSSSGFVHYLRKAYNWREEQILRYNGQIAEWLNDKERGTQGLITNEPFLATQAGANPRALLIADVGGYNPYQKMLFTTEDVISKEPELVSAVVAASIEGWRAYMESPDKTHDHLKSKNKDLTEDGMAYAYGAMKPLIIGGDAVAAGVGVMTQARWDDLYTQLKDVGLIKPDLDSKAVWTDAFLKQSARP